MTQFGYLQVQHAEDITRDQIRTAFCHFIERQGDSPQPTKLKLSTQALAYLPASTATVAVSCTESGELIIKPVY